VESLIIYYMLPPDWQKGKGCNNLELFGGEKITLMLEKYNYTTSETIKGTVTLKLKKPTKARKFEVAFIGNKI